MGRKDGLEGLGNSKATECDCLFSSHAKGYKGTKFQKPFQPGLCCILKQGSQIVRGRSSVRRGWKEGGGSEKHF